MAVKIIKTTKDSSTIYQVVDEAYEGIPENRSKEFFTVIEAVNSWLYPNNDESSVSKFITEIPIVEEEHAPEPVVGEIPHGNIMNMVMSRGQSPVSYYSLTNWCMSVLGYESMTDSSILGVGYDELKPEFISELNNRVQKIGELGTLLQLLEMAEAGKRGCRRDKYNDSVCDAVIQATLNHLSDFALPPSLWHRVHRNQLWQESAETEVVRLPSPNGWVSFSGVRPAKHGAWSVRMRTPDGVEHDSPQYVEKMGLKAKNQNEYAKGRTGVECQAFHLFNEDGTLWGFEVYLISPRKTVGCEVTKDGRFSLFRKGVYLPPRQNVIRQGDALFRRLDVQPEDDIVSTPTTCELLRSVDIRTVYSVVKLSLKPKEHKHDGYDYWHPVSRQHEDYMHTSNEEARISPYSPGVSEYTLKLDEDSVLTHPDHPSITLKAGYWQVLPVEGETDFQPPQRRGD